MRLLFWKKRQADLVGPGLNLSPGPELSPGTRRRVQLLFEPDQQDEATKLLAEECGNNLPFCEEENMYQMERIRYAALKVARGNISRLHVAVSLAKTDWRDLLAEAGFQNDLNAHQAWLAKEAGELQGSTPPE
jgi:hypothetical protein